VLSIASHVCLPILSHIVLLPPMKEVMYSGASVFLVARLLKIYELVLVKFCGVLGLVITLWL